MPEIEERSRLARWLGNTMAAAVFWVFRSRARAAGCQARLRCRYPAGCDCPTGATDG